MARTNAWLLWLLVLLLEIREDFKPLIPVSIGVSGRFIIPRLPNKRFAKLGDINIGVMVPLSRYNRGQGCSNVTSPMSVHYPQILDYAVAKINSRKELPGNLTLGFVIVDDCYKENIAVAQSLMFVPQTTCHGQETPNSTNSDVLDSYDVVAVIGSTLSSQSVAVSHLLGPAQVPLVSFYSTSDDLSDKGLFPYFLRTTPPDRFQFQAIFSLIMEYGWTYVSVIYMEGSYGENGFKQLRQLFDSHGICLAAVHKVPTIMTDEEAVDVVKDLVEHSNARAVVVITTYTNAFKVINAAKSLAPIGTFIWLGTDSWGSQLRFFQELGDMLLDSFHVTPLTALASEYEQHFQQLTPSDTDDPWFLGVWEEFFRCSLAQGTCRTNLTVNASGFPYIVNPYSGNCFDTISMISAAIGRVLQSPDCQHPHAQTSAAAARACVTGPRLLAELKMTRQDGYTGWLELDSNGDRLGRYLIRQVVKTSENASLSYLTRAQFDTLSRRIVWRPNASRARRYSPRGDLRRLESRCSRPCQPHEARVVQEVVCCWLCQPCRLNERLVRNGTRCAACPPHAWPDPLTANATCLLIEPDTLRLDSLVGGVQLTIGLVGAVVNLVVVAFFYRHRQRPVIKASSRELSFLMLLAIGVGYIVIVSFLARPNDFTCRLNFFFFCVSFTLLYGPLCLRALRIFRIFEASKTSALRPKMTNCCHQLLFAFLLVLVQVLMCVVVMVVHGPWHKKTQPSLQREYVELTCDVPLWGLASFLAYNLLLVTVCTLLAFKTRRLPDNFNESRFISMCVSTTLVILLCFIPAYLVSGSELLKMLMLALAAALNHSVALVFLFVPKIYVVHYLEGASAGLGSGGQRPMFSTSESSRTAMGSTCANCSLDHPQTSRPALEARAQYGVGSVLSGERSNSTMPTPAPNFLQVRPATYSSTDL